MKKKSINELLETAREGDGELGGELEQTPALPSGFVTRVVAHPRNQAVELETLFLARRCAFVALFICLISGAVFVGLGEKPAIQNTNSPDSWMEMEMIDATRQPAT